MLVWFATLVAMADGLNRVGFLPWVGKSIGAATTGVSPTVIVVVLVVAFYVVHYLFASLAAQTTALLPVFVATAAAIPGVPVGAVALLLAFSLGLMGVISPYATGPAPIYYGSGYIAGRDFWRLGAILGAIFLAVLVVVGIPWVTMIVR